MSTTTTTTSSSVDDLVSGLAGLSLSPLSTFFARFPGFTYNTSANAASEYRRLCNRQKQAGKPAVRRQFSLAFEEEFNSRFGGSVQDWDWQRLCEILEVKNVPMSKTQAKKVLQRIHVNLYDLEHYDRRLVLGQPIELKIFPTVQALSNYSTNHLKVFLKPKKGKGALRWILRELFSSRGY